MTTEYSLTDSLPKDLGGAKHLALIDDSTSQLDYALIRGIGSEPLGGASKNVAHMGVATHTIGSAVGPLAGVLGLGIYSEAPTAVGTAQAQALRTDNEGALFTRPASGIPVFSSASIQTHISGSLLLHGLQISGADVNAGDTVIIQDGDDTRFPFVFSTTSQVYYQNFTTGVVFSTSLKHVSSGANASVTLIYSQY